MILCIVVNMFFSVSASAADTSRFKYGSKTGKFIMELYDYMGTKTGEVTFYFKFDSEYTQDKDGNPTKATVTTSKKKIGGSGCYDYTYKSVERYNLKCAYNGFSIKGTIKIQAYCYMESLGNNIDSSKTGRLNFNNIYPYGTPDQDKTSSLTTTATDSERTVTFYIQVNAGNLGFTIEDNGGHMMDETIYPNKLPEGGVARIKLQMARDKHKLTVNKDDGIQAVSGGGKYYYGESYSAGATAKGYHVFTGWTGDVSSTSNPYSGVMPNKNITLKANSREYQYKVHFDGNGATGGTMEDMTDLNYSGTYSLTGNAFSRTDYKFTGWNTAADGSGISYADKASFSKLCDKDGGTVTFYAQWKPKTAPYTVKHWKQRLNGTAGVHNETNYELAETEVFTAQVGKSVSPAVKTYTGFKSPAVQQGTVESDGSLVIQYYYDRQSYLVTLYAGTGIESTSGDGSYLYGNTVNVSAELKEGYHWKDWTGTYQTDQQSYSFTMPAQNVTMTANGEANTYTIRFDPNGGTGHIDDIVTTYDTDVTLPDATDIYKKYTLDGVNVTDDVVSGAIPEDMIVQSDVPDAEDYDEENPDEEDPDEEDQGTGEAEKEELQFEEPETEVTNPDMEETELPEDDENNEADLDIEEEQKAAQSLKRAYKSVFLGWAFYDDKDKLIPTWKAGEVVKNLTAEDGGTVTLYAVWDDCPWIQATDLYFSLEQAQSGFITELEILNHATAEDREDGSPILPGINPAANRPDVNTSFTIPEYRPEAYTSLTEDAVIPEILSVTDSAGSTYQKQIMVYVVDTTPKAIKPAGTVRFISEKYYNADYEHGGLADNSIWKTNPEYRTVLQKTFDNLKNDTPEETYYFSHETILEMKAFIKEHGFSDWKEPDALQKFYEQFMEPNRVQ